MCFYLTHMQPLSEKLEKQHPPSTETLWTISVWEAAVHKELTVCLLPLLALLVKLKSPFLPETFFTIKQFSLHSQVNAKKKVPQCTMLQTSTLSSVIFSLLTAERGRRWEMKGGASFDINVWSLSLRPLIMSSTWAVRIWEGALQLFL